ncbi:MULTISPECIES: alpha/beta fold hydrolase [Bacillus]|uniref:Pimelyl-[acyl-carrier protein] methyl esterase n=2 Tax=Bacillus cereus group TaxID=86661 RepID=R8Q4Z3_BACCE|nr:MULTISPECIES: alpha/beta hydrolase [Bacillus cereus group]EOP66201.1 pimelyl-[acyl-carrier protein] methyl esterase [Bacillus cereus VD118]MBJ8068334.1 alpha/beta fold hydrolase [Bacillus cereus]MBJ8092506.1 alpha/beta fold hydrolase [Bacillus cereus]MBJ8185530.1 alpha/beta fold hydrolase [Bacillus cereus]MCQ6356136.1 alpha/beta hydrolase [Bacillus cereus]
MKELKVIFIPGWGMEEDVWTFVLPYFKDYPVQCLDWRNVKEQSEFAGRIIEVARDENVILVGWSLGALAAIQAYKKIKAKGIVLIGGTAKFTNTSDYTSGWNSLHVERMKKNLTRKKEDTLNRFYENIFTKNELKENTSFKEIALNFKGDSIQSLQLGLDYLIETDMRNELTDIKVPLLLLHGEQDVICPLSAAHNMTENTNATLKVVSGAGHALCVTNFEYCANEIIQFVEGIRHDQQNVTTKTV